MNAKSEQALVGVFVIVAAGVLVGTVFTISGAFGRSVKTYHTYFAFAGGLEPGATVRYSGGPKAGRVDTLRIDPQNPGRMEITFSVQSDVPVKTDSKAKIMSLSPLGENHLEIVPGSAKASLAPDGAVLPSEAYMDFNALTQSINDLAPDVQQLLHTLNDRATELKVTVERVNDLLNAQNRANLSATLANTRGMLEEDRPEIKSTLQHLDTVTAKLQPLLDDFRKTTAEANKTLDHVDSLIGENREDVHKAVLELRRTLANTTDLTAHLDQMLDVNSDNIDELLDNLRQISENLREFSATIKARPYSLIRSVNPREHKPGEQP
ncbi:MAG: MlaD family protein [Candidatus Acidiferrum sp.]|jgi:phospholipid/cholesterol/gamma-HCH transport system substrate-binding protein